MKPRLRPLARCLLLALGLAGAAAAPPLAAQTQGTLAGVVTDASTQRPIAGAQVSVQGSNRQTLTNASGEYRLNVAAGASTVAFSTLGYGSQTRAVTVSAGATVTLNVALAASAITLDELVVVGYGTQERGELTSAVSSVQGEALAAQPVAGLDAALQGRLAGVQVVQNAGNPGNAPSVRVRGAASISASNQPLYVVDGVPLISEDYSQLGMG
ncbi:MAG TPA: carboxypeptidase-like regulatory domain-containing protein, partial [Longimicrobium sp.]|nr:carboxypeptidase-like regulatory domain-containing protein [Longimicrobium sp.]